MFILYFSIRAGASPPLIRAMPERKHFFLKEVFPDRSWCFICDILSQMMSSILQRPSVCAHSQLAVQQIVIFCIIGFQSSKQSSEICAIVHNWVLYLWAIVREMQTSLMGFCSSECSELLMWTMIVMMTSISHEGQCVHIPNLSCNIAPSSFLRQSLPSDDVDSTSDDVDASMRFLSEDSVQIRCLHHKDF